MDVFNERIKQRDENKLSHIIKTIKLHLISVKLHYKLHINSELFHFIKIFFHLAK